MLLSSWQAVSGIAVLQDGSSASSAAVPLVVSGSRDGELRLWELASGSCVAQQSLPVGGVCGLGAALPEDSPQAGFYVGSTCGEVHAYRTDAQAGFRRVLTSTAR